MSIFHRYSSTIHGNYRRAYLRSGLLTGALMAGYVLVRLLMGNPMESPASLILDAILLVLLFLLTAWYRNGLPEKKITLKEAMLFGIGTAAVAGVVYGLALWAIGLSSAQQTVLFTTTMTGNAITAEDPQLHYWAAWWAILAGLEAILLGAFGAFLASIVFRNEKGEIRKWKVERGK
jgi:hypothetical protein